MVRLIDSVMQRRGVLLEVAPALLVFVIAGSLALHVGGPGEPVAGAVWVRATYAIGLGVAVLLRRRVPLAATLLFWGVVGLQAVTTSISNEGLHMIIAIGTIAYASARNGDRRSALLTIPVHLAGYGVYTAWNADFRIGGQANNWAVAFFAVYAVALWLLGWAVRSHRDRAASTEATLAQAAASAEAVSAERARIARELHDVVSHQLSVVVVQAAGARAQHPEADDQSTLAKIENSGREALAEMRHLLDVLRADDAEEGLAPTPDLRQLEPLVETVRRTGFGVDLSISEEVEPVSPGVALTVFRIVQEALTNSLKHSGGTSATVTIVRLRDDIVIEVVDDGFAAPPASGGHGLVGMRERVSLLGGTLEAGQVRSPDHGFRVRARIPGQSGAG